MERRGQSDRVITMQDIERIVGRLTIENQALREEVMRLEEELAEIRQGGEDDIETSTPPQHSPRSE